MILVWVGLAFLVGWTMGAVTALGFARRRAVPTLTVGTPSPYMRWRPASPHLFQGML